VNKTEKDIYDKSIEENENNNYKEITKKLKIKRIIKIIEIEDFCQINHKKLIKNLYQKIYFFIFFFINFFY